MKFTCLSNLNKGKNNSNKGSVIYEECDCKKTRKL